jgi:primase-polymerase (primpol)-like protein
MSIIRSHIPAELIEWKQWLIWRYVQKSGTDKPAKVPHTCTGYQASSMNPDHWSSFEFALKAAARPGFADGIGFVFTVDDPYCGIDLDNVWQSDADEGAEWTQGILERFKDTYGEASPSNTGFKIWCKAKTPKCGKWPVQSGAIEIYDNGRFFTMTGRSNSVPIIADHQADIEALVENLEEHRRESRPQARVIPDVIPQGRRHNTLVSLAGTMWKRGMSAEAVAAALLETNHRQCDPPYAPEHIRKIVASMANWSR